MDCHHARGLLSDGASGPGLEEHLRACEGCRTFADALDTVLYHAPALVPAAPDELASGVRADLGLPPPPGAPRPADRMAGARQRLAPLVRGSRAGLVAALAGGLVGVVVVLAVMATPDEPDAAAVLAATVEAHTEEGASFGYDLAGEIELDLRGGTITEGRRHLAAELERLSGDPAAEAVADPTASDVMTVSYRVRGEGDGRGRLAYELRWRSEGPVAAGGTAEVRTVDGRTRVTGPAGWTLLDGSAGFDLGVVTVPHHLGEVLAALDDAEEVGELPRTEVGGREVRHLRARTADGLVVDVWVDADRRLHRLQWLPPAPEDDGDGTTHGELTARLRDHDQPVVVDAPAQERHLAEVPDDDRPPFVPRDGR